jgi:hypothetical protein
MEKWNGGQRVFNPLFQYSSIPIIRLSLSAAREEEAIVELIPLFI